MSIATIEWKNNALKIIDQTKLPLQLKYLYCRDVRSVWNAIRLLKVRGAPAIGITAAFGVVLGMEEIKTDDANIFIEHLEKVIAYLVSSRPTAVNLFWALARMKKKALANSNLKISEMRRLLLREAMKILEEDKEICRSMADFGSQLIKDNDHCLTICNAGALATADYGTALGVFYRAKEKGKSFKVFVCETRPLLQGARLSSWELKKQNIEVTLITDNSAGYLMAEGLIQKVFVGADRIVRNGDTANKIGTCNLAILSYEHKIPFYVVAPGSSFDLKLESGEDIPIEHRHKGEVFKLQSLRVAPYGVEAYNPAFDVTPNKFVSAFVTEKGIIYPPFKNIKLCITNGTH